METYEREVELAENVNSRIIDSNEFLETEIT